jgi:hypothetical protein
MGMLTIRQVSPGATELARYRVATPRNDYTATIAAIVDLTARLMQGIQDGARIGTGIPGSISYSGLSWEQDAAVASSSMGGCSTDRAALAENGATTRFPGPRPTNTPDPPGKPTGWREGWRTSSTSSIPMFWCSAAACHSSPISTTGYRS